MISYLITLTRGMLAMVLGLALILEPDKVRPLLANFIGMFWLTSGVLSLRWGAAGQRIHGWAVTAGVVGMLAGLGLVLRRLMPAWIPPETYLGFLGIVALVTGLMHALGGFRTGGGTHRRWSLTSFLLGLFEVALGIILIIEPLGRSRLFYLSLTAWAIAGGVLLIGDSLRQRQTLSSSSSR